jgi:hypothetical protein
MIVATADDGITSLDTLQGVRTQVATFEQVGAVQKVAAVTAGVYLLNASGQIYTMDAEMKTAPALYHTLSDDYNIADLAGDSQGSVYLLDQSGKTYTFRSGLESSELSLVEVADFNQYVNDVSLQALNVVTRGGVESLAVTDETSGHILAYNLESREFDTLTTRALVRPTAVAHDDGVMYVAQRESADIAVIQEGTLKTTIQIAEVAEPAVLAVGKMCKIDPLVTSDDPNCESDPSLEGCVSGALAEEEVDDSLPAEEAGESDTDDGFSVGDFDPASSFGGTVGTEPLNTIFGGYVLNGAAMCSLNSSKGFDGNISDFGLVLILLSYLGLIRFRARRSRS